MTAYLKHYLAKFAGRLLVFLLFLCLYVTRRADIGRFMQAGSLSELQADAVSAPGTFLCLVLLWILFLWTMLTHLFPGLLPEPGGTPDLCPNEKAACGIAPAGGRPAVQYDMTGSDYMRLWYRPTISSTLVSRGLPGQQASANALSARNRTSSSFTISLRSKECERFFVLFLFCAPSYRPTVGGFAVCQSRRLSVNSAFILPLSFSHAR